MNYIFSLLIAVTQLTSTTEAFFSVNPFRTYVNKTHKLSLPSVTVISNTKVYIEDSEHYYYAPKKNAAKLFSQHEGRESKSLFGNLLGFISR